MTLQLHKVSNSVLELGHRMALRAKERQANLPRVLEALRSAGLQADLAERAQHAWRGGWFGALPAGEALDVSRSCPPLPESITVVAADGSQIYPDRHAAAMYYAINIGYFVARIGTGQTEADSLPEIVADEAQLYCNGELVNPPTLNARRTVRELTTLAEVAVAQAAPHSKPPGTPVVALLDGSLALRARTEAIAAADREELEGRYLAALGGLAAARIPVAGFVSRPGGSPLLSLLALAEIPRGELDHYLKSMSGPTRSADLPLPFRGLSDRLLFEARLEPGERSAIFEFGAEWNEVYRRTPVPDDPAHSQSVHFFYLNVGRTRAVVARVEVPHWVAARPLLLDRVQALLLEQSRATHDDPYPYALTRADEEAVIRTEEKMSLDLMFVRALMEEGLAPTPSEKLAHKQRARYGKRHRT